MCYLHFVEKENTGPYIIAYLTCFFYNLKSFLHAITDKTI